MKKKLVILLAALMLVGSTTALAAPSPEINSPEIDSPEIDSPEIDSPEIDSPEIDSPEIDSPEVKPDSPVDNESLPAGDIADLDDEALNKFAEQLIVGKDDVTGVTVLDVKKLDAAKLREAAEILKQLVALNDGLSIDLFTILAAFDITVEETGAVTLTVKVDVAADDNVVVLHEYAAGKWEVINKVKETAGAVEFTLESLSPVVIVKVDADAEALTVIEREAADVPGTDEPGTDEPGTDEPGDDENDGPTSPEGGDLVVFPAIALAGLAGAAVCSKKIKR